MICNNHNEGIGLEKGKESRLPILSFFTGGGFLDIGFEQNGFEIVWTNESNQIFADMYEYGMTSWRRSLIRDAKPAKISDRRNIITISVNEIMNSAFPQSKPRYFGIIGGPPCPDFSSGGKNRGSSGDKGHLSEIFIDRICEMKPDFFVFENVPGLLRTKHHRAFLEILERKLRSNSYLLDLKVLNSLELGLPQDRERVILIGLKQDIIKLCLGRHFDINETDWFPWPEHPEFKDAKKRFDWPGIVLRGEEVKKPESIPDRLMVSSILDGDNHPCKQLNGTECFKPHSDKFNTICEGDTKRKSFKRLHRYRYSPTACYGHNEVHLHPWEDRRLTVRETMRIQGIPDTYALPPEGQLTSKFKLIGNGVPVLLAREVAKSLCRLLTPLFT
jgi:DNA (cytosine-5)-methyltransferase 1